MRTLLLFAFIVLLCGCGMDSVPDSMLPKAENAYATDYISKLFANDTAYCLNRAIYTEVDDAGLLGIRRTCTFLKGQKVTGSRVLDTKETFALTGTKDKYTRIDYEYALKDGFVYFHFTLIKDHNSGAMKIAGFNANYEIVSLAKKNEFTLTGKGFLQYFFLIAAVLLLLFKIITIIVAFRTKISRKALWILFILFSIFVFTVNWTTGELSMNLLHLDLAGAGMTRGGVAGPWLLRISFPLGAVIFWAKRRQLKQKQKSIG